jgi:hypothetical protein
VSAVEIAHLFIPIDWRATLAFAAIGLGGLWLAQFRHKRCLAVALVHFKNNPFLVIATVFIWVTLCGHTMGFPDAYDSGLYHYQMIRWMAEHPIVPGLGNLHSRFAYNNSYFGFVALLNASPLYDRGYAMGGLLLLTLMVLTSFAFCTRRLGQSGILACLIALLTPVFAEWLGSPNPDLPGAMVQIVIFLLLLRVILVAGTGEKTRARIIACLLLLCTVSVTLKLSGLVFAATTLLVLLPFSYRIVLAHRWIAARIFALCLLFVVIHLGRGYLLSGAPLYPNTLGGAWGLDWAVPIDVARVETSWIASWARKPDVSPQDVLGDWKWLSSWAGKVSSAQWLMIVSPALPLLGLLLRCWRAPLRSRSPECNLYLLFVPFIASLVFWFFTAPNFRFLGAILYLQAIFSIWLFTRQLQQVGFGVAEFLERPVIFKGLLPILLIWASGLPHYSFLSGWREIPLGPTEMRTTRSGLRVASPLKEGNCWSGPLPCTPYFNDELRLRNAADGLRSGFSVR